MKNTVFFGATCYSRFYSGFVLSSIFAFLSHPILSVWKMIGKMGYVFLSVASLSLAVAGNVSKRRGGCFLQGDTRVEYLSFENSVDSLSEILDGSSVRYA